MNKIKSFKQYSKALWLGGAALLGLLVFATLRYHQAQPAVALGAIEPPTSITPPLAPPSQPQLSREVGATTSSSSARRRTGPPPSILDRWQFHPRGLGATIEQVVAGEPGPEAALLAQQVAACSGIDRDVDRALKELNRPTSERLQNDDVDAPAKTASYLKIKQDCSTVVGDDVAKLRMSSTLFVLASKQGVVGAAARSNILETYDNELAQALLRDARAGDIPSMATVGWLGGKAFGISKNESLAYAHAVLRAQDNRQFDLAFTARLYSEQMLERARIPHATAITYDAGNQDVLPKHTPTASFAAPQDAKLVQLGIELDKAMQTLESERRLVGVYGVKRKGP